MTIDHASFEERPYTRQHDRMFEAIVQQIQELDVRMRFLETRFDPEAEDPSDLELESVMGARESSLELSDTIESIGASLHAVVASLDSRPLGAMPPPTEPAPDAGADAEPDGEPIVVDLDRERQRNPTWRGGTARQPGWLPVSSRPSR